MGFVAPTVTPMTRPVLAEPFHKQPDDQPGNARFWAARISWRLASARRWLTLCTRVVWFEACSAVPRIKISLGAIAELPEGIHDLRDLGPWFEESTEHGGLVLHSGIQRRIQDEDKFLSMFPWATDADVHLFLLGREMGRSCACDSSRRIEKAAATTVAVL